VEIFSQKLRNVQSLCPPKTIYEPKNSSIQWGTGSLWLVLWKTIFPIYRSHVSYFYITLGLKHNTLGVWIRGQVSDKRETQGEFGNHQLWSNWRKRYRTVSLKIFRNCVRILEKHIKDQIWTNRGLFVTKWIWAFICSKTIICITFRWL